MTVSSTQRRVNPDRPMEIMLIDLDDCLYQQPGMAQQVSRNIQKYMVEYLGFSEDTVQEESRALYLEHGTTLSGLVNALGKTIDYDHWHSHVHWSLDYKTYIRPDPTLRKMLDGIPVKKFIFTNADKRHAAICLDLLGLTDCFSGVICFETMLELVGKYPDRVAKHNISPKGGVLCKPHPLAWEMALAHVDGDASVTMFFDDSPRNIASAHAYGIYSVLVNPNRIDTAYDCHIPSMHHVPSHLPWLTSVGDGIDHSRDKDEEDVLVTAEETPVVVQA